MYKYSKYKKMKSIINKLLLMMKLFINTQSI